VRAAAELGNDADADVAGDDDEVYEDSSGKKKKVYRTWSRAPARVLTHAAVSLYESGYFDMLTTKTKKAAQRSERQLLSRRMRTQFVEFIEHWSNSFAGYVLKEYQPNGADVFEGDLDTDAIPDNLVEQYRQWPFSANAFSEFDRREAATRRDHLKHEDFTPRTSLSLEADNEDDESHELLVVESLNDHDSSLSAQRHTS
jgi:hypothetical protein